VIHKIALRVASGDLSADAIAFSTAVVESGSNAEVGSTQSAE
jgi:hypothetical protein